LDCPFVIINQGFSGEARPFHPIELQSW
jgi:hypothetical protein